MDIITQTIPYPNILAFVEGEMERLFINNNFHYVDVVPVQNGEGWTVERLSDQIASKYFTKNANPDLVIVWVDRERQEMSSAEMAAHIRDALKNRGADPCKVHICIPDIMSENVILADEVLIADIFQLQDYKYDCEGRNGKYIIASLYWKELNINYKETRHGVQLLKKMRLERSASVSPSAKSFFDSLKLDCWWLEGKNMQPQAIA